MKQIAHDLLEINAVTLAPQKPFIWASGIKSPIYCDNRLTISYPKIRTRIAQGLAALIKDTFPEVEVIAGTATAGIPHAAWIAEELQLPLVYVRSKPKDHGQGKQIEGVLHAGQKTVLIDDLISTGGSVLQAVRASQKEGAEVIGVCGIFSYQLKAATENFAQAKIPFETLTNYSELIDVAEEEQRINAVEKKLLQNWRKDPENWQ
ncbi:orotate phosphoribosyltransferase [Liquorilactobacillus satsumensis]|uniref:Orotate phosphoribosyltransferase n=1 Tax=Liquorilactobacillus satsumensis DSM 16230 = JCM 12392 TaxID=1423801 RepID=A0A0R1V3B8_9LACO|nr:orotate phosphoribosyltransferase [Liquorilactobacillus satsumensis]KRL99998.1 orotate phosphoribosyltransferase [Liquorilactobacillus satsumensis DSM 16230 = JCM 12392]MCC7667066.1 orotate phosphoribosyltransferase [Liquorilactobacillus satsumensis]MCP9311722.1 orotate phosphoribosyltransferase [Liquorilactobacillus satsumensis]MCP9357266.1 orotate phosphoribosyltransferase [Liquorilactobacillus satsumensis]MCP9358855.1 orotate phosphoribosyltransferase [Liquorilactobacillus satsumensis]